MEIFVAISGRESGPFTPEQIPSMVEAGMLSLTDSLWHRELPEWIPVHRFLGVRPPVPMAQEVASVRELPSHSGEPAHFGRRIGASIVDGALYYVGAGGGLAVLFTVLFGPDYDARMTDAEVSQMAFFPAAVLAWVYSAGMESGRWRATVGKLIFGLVVADLDGRPVSFWQASRRFSWKALGGMTMGLTLLPTLWTLRRQNVHDLLSRTLVLRK